VIAVILLILRDMAVSVLRMLQEIVAQKLATQIVTTTAKLFHSGGVVGAGGGTFKMVDPAILASAPRLHTGGIAGLAPGEVPAILEQGEEVLTKKDPRHVANGGGQSASQSIKMVLVDDRDSIGDYMSSAAGEKVQIETIRRNSGVIKRILG
jgi:hypothetical protein